MKVMGVITAGHTEEEGGSDPMRAGTLVDGATCFYPLDRATCCVAASLDEAPPNNFICSNLFKTICSSPSGAYLLSTVSVMG